MKYDGIVCDGCGREFTPEDDVVVCPVCGTPQHRECWNRENNCVNAEKHAEGFSWIIPMWKKKEDEAKKTENEIKKEENKSRKEERIEELMNDPRLETVKFKNGEGLNICRNCGAINSENDAVCCRCGNSLKDSSGGISSQQGGHQANGFEMLRLYGGLDCDAEIDSIPVKEISAYIGGRKPGRFIRRFVMADRSGKNISFNPAVIIFGPLWYFYRKMPKLGMLFVIGFAALSLISTTVQMDDAVKNYYIAQGEIYLEVLEGKITSEEMTEKFAEITQSLNETATDTWRTVAAYACEAGHIALYLFMVMKADSFYRKKIKTDVENIRARNNNMNDYMADLSYSGGTSIPLAVVGAVIFLISSLAGSLPAYYYMFTGM